MNESGFIHFDCYCGADLYYLVCSTGADDFKSVKDSLAGLVRHPHFAIYSDLDGVSADCPHCGSLIELPDPETVDFLRQLSWSRLERPSVSGVPTDIAREWSSSAEVEPSSRTPSRWS